MMVSKRFEGSDSVDEYASSARFLSGIKGKYSLPGVKRKYTLHGIRGDTPPEPGETSLSWNQDDNWIGIKNQEGNNKV